MTYTNVKSRVVKYFNVYHRKPSLREDVNRSNSGSVFKTLPDRADIQRQIHLFLIEYIL